MVSAVKRTSKFARVKTLSGLAILSGEKYSNGVKNKTSTLLEHCLARICQTSIMLGT